MNKVSIIIPSLNEEACIEKTLNQLLCLQPQPHEIIMVDGGSLDKTVNIAQSYPLKLIVSKQAGRGRQMNQGAAIATGDILCFLHADTSIPNDAVELIEKICEDVDIAAGGFISIMCGENQTRWSVSLHNYLKTYYAPLIFRPYQFFAKGLRLLFGDQVIFCRRDDFWQCGGFNPNLTIMEDADFCLRINQLGKIYLVNRIVQSSDRRVAKWGVIKATFIYLYVGILWGLGVSDSRLNWIYPHIR